MQIYKDEALLNTRRRDDEALSSFAKAILVSNYYWILDFKETIFACPLESNEEGEFSRPTATPPLP